jgi:hypothetical protein
MEIARKDRRQNAQLSYSSLRHDRASESFRDYLNLAILKGENPRFSIGRGSATGSGASF